jgi:hypothetical protein
MQNMIKYAVFSVTSVPNPNEGIKNYVLLCHAEWHSSAPGTKRVEYRLYKTHCQNMTITLNMDPNESHAKYCSWMKDKNDHGRFYDTVLL